MKLHWSPRSPYVRKVMIVLGETGLTDRVECVRTAVSATTPVEELFADNPLNKIPTLMLDDGMALFDSRVICEYLDTQHDGPKLFPAGGPERLLAVRNLAFGDGLVDVAMVRNGEKRKPPERRTPEIIASNERKTRETLDRLERDVAMLTERPYDIGHVAIGTAVAYIDFRLAEDSWRDGRPALAAWYDSFAARPAVSATAFVDDS